MVLTELVTGHVHMKSGMEITNIPTTVHTTLRTSIPTNRAAMRNFGTTASKFNVYKY